MIDIKSAAAIAGLLLTLAVSPAFAISSEPAPVNSDGTSQIVDPDDQLDDLANPTSNPNSGGSLNFGSPSNGNGSISTFWGTQPAPAGGLPPVPGGSGN